MVARPVDNARHRVRRSSRRVSTAAAPRFQVSDLPRHLAAGYLVLTKGRVLPGERTTIKLFNSSTFSDMHAERDFLNSFVFPAVRCRSAPPFLNAAVLLMAPALTWIVSDQLRQASDRLLVDRFPVGRGHEQGESGGKLGI